MHKEYSRGFTIVELLIVIVVIAILAAITVATYNGIQTRARGAEVSTALKQAAKKLELFKIDNGNFPTTNNLANAGIEDGNVTYQYTSNGITYCLTGTSGTTSYKVTQTSNPTQGGCNGHGQGGVPAITNMIYNPAVATLSGYGAWSGGNGATTVSRQTATWTTRGYAARATWSTSNTSTLQGLVYWVVPNATGPSSLKPNTQYTATWKVRTSKSQRLSVGFSNVQMLGGGNGTATVTTNGSSGAQIVNANTPTTQWVTFTTDSAAVAGIIYSGVAAGTGSSNWLAGDYIEIGDMILVEGSNQYSYADGDSPNWVWNGTANSATSTGPPL